VCDGDLGEFDDQIQPMKTQARQSVAEFLTFVQAAQQRGQREAGGGQGEAGGGQGEAGGGQGDEDTGQGLDSGQLQTQAQPDQTHNLQSWETLAEVGWFVLHGYLRWNKQN